MIHVLIYHQYSDGIFRWPIYWSLKRHKRITRHITSIILHETTQHLSRNEFRFEIDFMKKQSAAVKKKKIRSTFEDTESRFHLSSDWSAEWLDGCLLAQFCQIQFPPCIFFIAFQLQSVKSRIWSMHTYKSIQFLIVPRNVLEKIILFENRDDTFFDNFIFPAIRLCS